MEAREPLNVTRTPTTTTKMGQHSPWHSPVPYLFGGLAAMLGLIAFALLILACSYWKLSGYLENQNEAGERDLESGDGNKSFVSDPKEKGSEEKILVIVAGHVKPTYIGIPMSSRSSSFGDTSSTGQSCSCSEKAEQIDVLDGVKDHEMISGDGERSVEDH